MQIYFVKLFSVDQIRAWDKFTIANEPIASIKLMERAAKACSKWISSHYPAGTSFIIICGKGNNGGDGLAIARMLQEKFSGVSTYVIEDGSRSEDFDINFDRLTKVSKEIFFIIENEDLPLISNCVVIDAIFGTGLSKKPAKLYKDLIKHINANAQDVISIDIPSGLYADKLTDHELVVEATTTLSFQSYKLAFLIPDSAIYCGKVVILDIDLSEKYEEDNHSEYEMVDLQMISEIYRKRNDFSNKGDYGYACLLAGSYGMMGAAVLSSLACLRSGVGKLSSVIPSCGYEILQSVVPEAMCNTSGTRFVKNIKDYQKYDVIGFGPGIGKHATHKIWIRELFTKYKKPLIIDADALNILSELPTLLSNIPAGSIITPHPKEFERLFGPAKSGWERISQVKKYSKKLQIYIVLKGHYTFIASPNGKYFFNSTGNAGMATAGAGDVLTGIITGLVAQGYDQLEACQLGVYLHGLAGDIAEKKTSKESLIAGDIINSMGEVFKFIDNSCL